MNQTTENGENNTQKTAKETVMDIDRLSFKKIFFHIDKIHELNTTGDAYPLHMVIGFTDYCNHDCLWCYTAYSTHDDMIVLEDGTRTHIDKVYDDRVINPDALLKFMKEARDKGLKSVKVVGSGEPLLHPQSAEMLEEMGKMGIELGVLGNGQRMNDRHIEVLTQYATFFRFSLDAADQETYRKLHGPQAKLDQTLENMRKLVAARKASGSDFPTIGAQYVTSQLNAEGMAPFTKMMRDIGIDYVTFKPMYNNPINRDRAQNTMPVEEALTRLQKVKEYDCPDFTVYDKDGEQFRNTWQDEKFNGAVYYQKCMAHQFVPTLYANGDMYICPNLAGRKEYVLGNIYQNSLEEIWQSDRRKKAIASIDLCQKCPARCYLDPLNKILWDISHPDRLIHPNFI